MKNMHSNVSYLQDDAPIRPARKKQMALYRDPPIPARCTRYRLSAIVLKISVILLLLCGYCQKEEGEITH